MEKCFALHLFTDSSITNFYFFFASLGLYLREKEREKKTNSTKNLIIYTDQPSFPQRLLTFLPYGDNK